MKIINKKILTSVFIIAAAVIFCGKFNAQSVRNLEEKISRLNKSVSVEEIKFDSLKHIFILQTEKINIEKSRKVIDKNLIAELMSTSLTIDERITEQSAKVNTLKNEIEQTKKLLSDKYKSAVDSLTMKLAIAPEAEQKKIEQEILNFNQKLVLLSPITSNLAFNPIEILKLDLAKVSDPTERTIVNEYLSSALSEVNNQLAVVSDQLNEINRATELQQRAEEFIEDVQMDNNISNIRSSRSDDRVYSASSGGRDELSVNINKLVPQALVYSSILMQLNKLAIDGNETKRWTYDSLQTNLSINSYTKLLQDVKTGLISYKKILESKLNIK